MPPKGSGIKKPKSARLGMVCKMLVKPSTGRCKNLRRVNSTPTGRPIRTAHALAAATSNRCSPTSVNRSRQLCVMNSNRFIANDHSTCLQRRKISLSQWIVGSFELVGRGEQADAPCFHQRDARAEHERLAHVVCDEHAGLAESFTQSGELALQTCTRQRIERAERLVHEQQRRVGRQRAPDADALPLPARQLARKTIRETLWLKSDKFQ